MKTIVLVASLLIASCVSAQVKNIYTNGDTVLATTTWQSLSKPNSRDNINGFSVDQDGTGGNLFIAFDDDGVAPDTSVGRRIRLSADEGLVFTGISIQKIWYKSSYGSISFRIRYW